MYVPVFKVNGPSLLSVFNDPEEDVGVNGSLVGLVQNHPTVAGQKRVCKKNVKVIRSRLEPIAKTNIQYQGDFCLT